MHGSRPAVTGILHHPDIKAVSFVGSDQAGRYIYERGCANGKRVQASSGAARCSARMTLRSVVHAITYNMNAVSLVPWEGEQHGHC